MFQFPYCSLHIAVVYYSLHIAVCTLQSVYCSLLEFESESETECGIESQIECETESGTLHISV